MSRLMALGTCLLLFGACSTSEPSPMFAQYIAAQEALADDDFTGAQQALKSMANAATESLSPLASAAAGSDDIETMRAAFKPLSEAIIGGEIPGGYVRAFCPMADGDRGASWVQKDGASLMNPYFGASMLHCGIFKD
ncbi:MAG: DUF3347 domain-containing protein [Candidatus Latescibacterota bacterium]|nr:DUF3347 domain-containing protein [Candidatus Latescibacterota bacterium]